MQPQGRQRAPAGSESRTHALTQHLRGDSATQPNLANHISDAPPPPQAHTVHIDPSLVPPFQASSGGLSQRLQEHALSEDDATPPVPYPSALSMLELAPGAYFVDRSDTSARAITVSAVTAPTRTPFQLSLPAGRDPTALFDPHPQYRDKAALLGHSEAAHPHATHTVRGSKLRGSYAVVEEQESPVATGAVPASAVAGMPPQSVFGVSDLSRGQQRIQQRWLRNVGVESAPGKQNPLSPRRAGSNSNNNSNSAASSRRPSRPASAAPTQSHAVAAAHSSAPSGPAFIPTLNLPIHTHWQSEIMPAKPAVHTHPAVPPHSFDMGLPPHHVPNSTIYAPLNTVAPAERNRPQSSTSRSQRAQQALSAAAATAASASARGGVRPASALPATAYASGFNDRDDLVGSNLGSIDQPFPLGSVAAPPAAAVASSASSSAPAPPLRSSKTRPSTAGNRPVSVRPITAAQAHHARQPSFQRAGPPDGSSEGLGVVGTNNSAAAANPAAAAAESQSHASSTSRPTSASLGRPITARSSSSHSAAIHATPSNLYYASSSLPSSLSSASASTAGLVRDEEEDGDEEQEERHGGEEEEEAKSNSFEAQYRQWKHRQQQQQQQQGREETPIHSARPASGASARPSSTSRAGRMSLPLHSLSRPSSSGSASARYRSSSRPSTARGAGAGGGGGGVHLIPSAATGAHLHYGAAALGAGGDRERGGGLVRVISTPADSDPHFAHRQAGLLLTSRARPPFQPGVALTGRPGGPTAARPLHSSAPLAPAALQPNAGFQTELSVAAHGLAELVQRAQEERKHFYSQALFWEYKFVEMMRATEPPPSTEASAFSSADAGNPAAGGRNTFVAGGRGGGGSGSGDPSRNTAGVQHQRARIVAATDHVYPSTYRTLATSYILQQVLPSLTEVGEAAGTSTSRATNVRALLRAGLGVLHRSIYMDVDTALVPPPPPHTHREGHTHLLKSSSSSSPTAPGSHSARRAEAWEEEVGGQQQPYPQGGGGDSRRSKHLAAIEGSGYAQVSHAGDQARALALAHAAREFDQALDDETLANVGGISSAGLSSSASVSPQCLPYFLSVKYLYESVQEHLQLGEALSLRVRRAEGQAIKILDRGSRRGVRLCLGAWRQLVRSSRARRELGARLARSSLLSARTGRRAVLDPHLLFCMWAQWARRQQLKRAYKTQLRQLASEVRQQVLGVGGATSLQAEGAQLHAYLSSIQASLSALAEESSSSSRAPLDVFSPLALQELVERFLAQLAWIEEFRSDNILPLALVTGGNSTSNAHTPSIHPHAMSASAEVDLLLVEIGRVGRSSSAVASSHRSDLRSMLLEKLGALRAREAAEEADAREALLTQPCETLLLNWVNAHLKSVGHKRLDGTAVGAQGGAGGGGGGGGWVLSDPSLLPTQGHIYLELLRSVAPQSVQNAAMAEQPSGGGGGAAHVRSPTSFGSALPSSTSASASPSTSTSTATEVDHRVIAQARTVLSLLGELGCRPLVGDLEDFLSHPSHGTLLKRLREQRAREKMGARARAAATAAAEAEAYFTRGNGGAGTNSDSSSTAAAAPSVFDPAHLAFHSPHPGDAGLTPSELGLAVDARGAPIRARRHVFDELDEQVEQQHEKGAASKQQQQQLQQKQQGNSNKNKSNKNSLPYSRLGSQGTHHHGDDAVAPSNPHLHLCLLASLFLQRPSLPASLTSSTTTSSAAAAAAAVVSGGLSFNDESWVEDARARVRSFPSQWEELRAGRRQEEQGQGAGASLADIHMFLSSLAHTGLEIDVLLERTRRRQHALGEVKGRMEGFIWEMQRRGKLQSHSVAASSATATGTEGGALGAPGRSDLSVSGEALAYTEIPLGKLLDVLSPSEEGRPRRDQYGHDGTGVASAAAAATAAAREALREYDGLKLLLGKHYKDLANIFRHYASLEFNGRGVGAGAGAGAGADAGAASESAAASSPLGACMSFAEFCVLCADCHLVSRAVNKGVLHSLFTRCTLSLRELGRQSTHVMPRTDADRLEHSPMGGGGGGGGDMMDLDASTTSSDGVTLVSSAKHTQLTLSQPALFEALIRLAALKYASSSGGGTSITERTRRLLEMDVLPNARRLRLDEFRALLSRDRVKHVFLAHRAELQAVFHHFARDEEPQSTMQLTGSASRDEQAQAVASAVTHARGRLITKAGFLRLAQEAHLFVTPSQAAAAAAMGGDAGPLVAFEESHLLGLLSAVLRVPVGLLAAQASTAVGAPPHSSASLAAEPGLSFPEFLEVLGGIAAYRSPDPYTPLQVKVESFIRGALLPPLRTLIRRLNQIRNSSGMQGAAVAITPGSSTSARTRRL